jgi:hypothetical protein
VSSSSLLMPHGASMDWDEVHRLNARIVAALDEVRQGMASENDVTRRLSIGLAVQWCEIFYGPMDSIPRDEAQVAIEEALRARGMSAERAKSMAIRASSSTGVPGAPLTTRVLAVRAMALRIRTGRSYRQIAYTLNGPCEHVCSQCEDVIREEMVQSGIRKRKQRPRCASCQCTIRPVGRKEQVCSKCADALRASVNRLRDVLRLEGIYPPASLPTRPLYVP